MKVWMGYGSEHSMNLVLIGKFKSLADAERTEGLLEKLNKLVGELGEPPSPRSVPEDLRFVEPLESFLRQHQLYIFHPAEFEQFAYDNHVDRHEDSITIRTQEADFSAFIKLFIEAGARVEVYSGHEYPENESQER